MARELTVELEAAPASPARARRALRAALREHGIGGDAYDFAVLAVSELVTNAICHGRGPIELRAEVPDDRVRVAVSDRGAPLGGDVNYPDPWATTGRGLAIVEAVSRDWGVAW